MTIEESIKKLGAREVLSEIESRRIRNKTCRLRRY